MLAQEFRTAFDVFERSSAELAPVVEAVAEAVRCGRRVHLFGAGTSGRLAALDAAELPPTFGIEPDVFEVHLAGGSDAMTAAIEGAEDDVDAGDRAGQSLTTGDVAIGLTASGRTPFVLAALASAKNRGAFTVQLDCNQTAASLADCHDTFDTGPEPIAGSTRLNAATAQKLALNAISTLAMVHVGRTYSNLMVCVQPNNSKLRSRLTSILQEITGATAAEVGDALEAADQHGRVALAMLTHGWDRARAERVLAASADLRSVLGPIEGSAIDRGWPDSS